MTTTSRPYHHGDLRSALVAEALELARAQGPSGVSLREATRRVGVTPSAAYRHFRDRSHLVEAVARQIQEQMAEQMQRRMNAPHATGAEEHALQRLRGVGLGYIAFGIDEPGWFETAFFGGLPAVIPAADGTGPDEDSAADPSADSFVPPPFLLLTEALDDCVLAGVLLPERRPGAEFVCWSAVHGCAELVLHGPLRGAERQLVEQIAERVVEDVITGIR